MADVHFRCLGCQQSLVADESGAGVSFNCPHCKTPQLIPSISVPPVALQIRPEAAKPAPPPSSQPASEGNLWVAQERLWQNEHQSAEQAVALIERDQRISALSAECDWLTAQVDEERQRRQALEPELDLARGGWEAAEKRANDHETAFRNATIRLQQTQATLQELTDQFELVKTERSEALLDLAHQQETLAELNLQLNQARAKRNETEQLLARARGELDRTARELSTAEARVAQSSVEASQWTAILAHLRAELGFTIVERDKLQAVIREDHGLAEYVSVRFDRDRFEGELRETQAHLTGLREKIESLTLERENLRRERTELQLTVAALRDAHDHSQLQQDNEVLRRMVERLNEELKEALPDISKRRRRESSGGVVGGLARAVASRIFVPDPDVAEGR